MSASNQSMSYPRSGDACASAFRDPADVVPALVWQISHDGMVEATNLAFDQTLGPLPKQSGPFLPTACVCPDDRKHLQKWWEERKERQDAGQIDLRLRNRDGELRSFLVTAAPINIPEGRFFWSCLGIDIEGRRRAEALLRDSEQEYRTIVDAISQYVVVLDPAGRVTYVNRVVTEQTGMSLIDVSGGWDAFARPFHPRDRDRVAAERRSGLAREDAFELEVRVCVQGGEFRWYLMKYKPLKDADGRVLRWYVTGTDVHEQHEQRDTLEKENITLREELRLSPASGEMIGGSAPMLQLTKELKKIAASDGTVLLLGETGTGKELVARAIHAQSKRKRKPFIRVNCAAIPQSLIMSELFGHEKGAFTGATERRQGRFEAAEHGTLFLDEIGELPLETQVALLRVLQEREFERIGSNTPVRVDIRVIAATHRNLLAAMDSGTFREDLFYRLNVLPITVPSLRQRAQDIPLLVEHFIARFAPKAGKHIRHIETETLNMLMGYRWPGNVRELQNVIERAVILSESDTLFFDESWLNRSGTVQRSDVVSGSFPELAHHEISLIRAALHASGGRISGPTGAAAKLGIPRQTLQSKIRKFKLNEV